VANSPRACNAGIRPRASAHHDPDLVILDEPTAGLDPIGCREVKDLIIALARRGKTVILSSHLLSDVEDVCDRVVIYTAARITGARHVEGTSRHPGCRAHHDAGVATRNDERVLDIIRKDTDAGKVRVDNPTQKPRKLLLDIVAKARASASLSPAHNPARAWLTICAAKVKAKPQR